MSMKTWMWIVRRCILAFQVVSLLWWHKRLMQDASATLSGFRAKWEWSFWPSSVAIHSTQISISCRGGVQVNWRKLRSLCYAKTDDLFANKDSWAYTITFSLPLIRVLALPSEVMTPEARIFATMNSPLKFHRVFSLPCHHTLCQN